jgi:Zn finger protein HypA/HybF involved in hydrogenase expression
MVAMLHENVYTYRGYEIDMSIYKNPPKLACAAGRDKTGGKHMGKPKKPKMEALKITCPHCQTLLDFDTSTLIVSPDPTEDATVATPQNKTIAVFKNENYTITCPSCNGDFEIDTTPDADATPMTPPNSNPVPQAKGKVKVLAKQKGKPKAAVVKPLKMQTETTEITCTECDTIFYLDVDPFIKEAEVECPNCHAILSVDTSNMGVEADDENGETNDYIVAQRAAMHHERTRIMTLDERAKAFPQFANAIEQFKKNGTSVECANNWIFKALAANPQEQNGHPSYLAAAKRDAAVLNKLGNPVRGDDKATVVAIKAASLAERRGIKVSG